MSDRNYHGLDDETLLESAGKGERKAFGELVRRHQNWAWKIAYRFTGSESESEDIVQTAFIRLLKSAPSFRRKASFKTYFHVIITRLCLDYDKRKKPVYTDTYSDIPDGSAGMEELLLSSENESRIRSAIDSLPPKQRMVIILKYFEDMGYEDIALALKTSKKAVERLLARGREGLRTKLK